MEQWLKQFRAAVEFRGISKAELARKADLDYQAVVRYLDEKRPEAPRIDAAIRLAAALDMTLDQAFLPDFPLASSHILQLLHRGLAAPQSEDDREAGEPA